MLVCIIGLETVYMELTWLVFRAPGYFWGPWSHWDSGVYVRCVGEWGWVRFQGTCFGEFVRPSESFPEIELFHSSHIPVLFFAFHSIPLHWLPQFGDYLKLFDIFQSGLKCKEKCKSVVFVRWQSCHSSTAHNFLESVLQSPLKVPCHAYPSCLCAASQCSPHHCGETVSIT